MSVSANLLQRWVGRTHQQCVVMFASVFFLFLLFFFLIGDFFVDATLKCDFIRGHLFEDSGVP